jgi:hypothetical protein
MKLRLLILLAAAALAAAPAAGQTIKSLGYNTTNGNIVAATNVTFTNSVGFATNARAATRTNLGLEATWLTNTEPAFFRLGIGIVSQEWSTNTSTFYVPISFGGNAFVNAANTRTNFGLGATWLTNTDVTNFRTAIGLGTTNTVAFDTIQIQSDIFTPALEASDGTNYVVLTASEISFQGVAGPQTRTNLGLGATNAVTFSNITASGTLAVSNTATFATNVTVNGSLSVGSFTTTTPSTWALDATQTAAATNGVLTLPSNANVIRLTNNNAISSVTNGVLGAFYYLVNQATNAVTISNVGGITIDGAQNLTLSPNESATLVATGPTNVSVAARGDLTDVALGGTANTAPSQTASSGSSLMTRDLVAQRLPFQLLNYDPVTSAMGAVTSANGGSGTPSVNKFDIRGGTNTNGVAVWRAGSGGGLGSKSSGRANVAWQGRVSVGWSISRILTNSEVRLQFGKDTTDGNFSTLGARGVGIYISNSSVFFETHDGTNHFQTTNSLTTSEANVNDSWMAVTSNGVASFYKNGTLITNVTNNVPNAQDSSAAFGYVIGVQNTTTNNSGVRIFTTPGFILQD